MHNIRFIKSICAPCFFFYFCLKFSCYFNKSIFWKLLYILFILTENWYCWPIVEMESIRIYCLLFIESLWSKSLQNFGEHFFDNHISYKDLMKKKTFKIHQQKISSFSYSKIYCKKIKNSNLFWTVVNRWPKNNLIIKKIQESVRENGIHFLDDLKFCNGALFSRV
jgi:hypothetical protein